MKILIILKKWGGGVGSVIQNVRRELEEKGHEVKVISRDEDLKINFTKSLKEIRKLVKKRGKDYDIIYTQDWSIAFPLIYPTRLFKEKHFCCFHGIQPGKTFFLQKRIGNSLGKNLIVVGDGLKKIFPKSNKIYNGIDLKKFKPIKNVKKIKNSVGFANWQTENYRFKEIKKAVKDSGKELVIAENIPFEKMPEFYNKVETFISLPPFCTGFNMSWIEAMACGVKKIIGNNAGIGPKLPIDRIENYNGSIKKALLEVKSKNYVKDVKESNFTLEKHVNRLSKLFKRALI